MVFWVAVAGLLVWVSFEFLLRGHGEARQWVGPADVGYSTRVLLVSFLISLVISLLLWIGYALGAGSWAAAILISLVLGGAYLYRIAAEERMLRAEFGATYQMYQQRTWRLIPGLF